MRKDEIHAAFHAAVSEELHRADEQHGDATDLYEMLAVLGEEYGELQKAVLQFDYEGGRRDHILKECIQVGAMACKTFRYITNNMALIPRGTVVLCPTCRRCQAEVGGDMPEMEMRFCSDAFHVFGASTPRAGLCPTCDRAKEERWRPEPLPGARGYHGDRLVEESSWCPDSFHA